MHKIKLVFYLQLILLLAQCKSTDKTPSTPAPAPAPPGGEPAPAPAPPGGGPAPAPAPPGEAPAPAPAPPGEAPAPAPGEEEEPSTALPVEKTNKDKFNYKIYTNSEELPVFFKASPISDHHWEGFRKNEEEDPLNFYHQAAKWLREKHPPLGSVIIKDKTFYISNIITKGSRDLAILYVEDKDKRMLAQLLYRSKSDGFFRVTPGRGDFMFSKGKRHYTQETKLKLEILLLLDKINNENKFENKMLSRNLIMDDTIFTEANKYFRKNIKEVKLSSEVLDALKIIRECRPGSCFKYKDYHYQSLNNLIGHINTSLDDSNLHEFVPNFSKPIERYTLYHTFLGKISIEIFHSQLSGFDIEWQMAYDKNGRVWIERIARRDIPASIYGTATEFIDSGVLTNKPLEYRSQSNRLSAAPPLRKGLSHKDNTGPDKYFDITPFLDKLSPIEDFRKKRKVYRK